MLKFFQLLTFYDGYLETFHQKHPEAAGLSHRDHLRLLLEDGFGGGHILAPYLADLGYEAGFTVVNSRPLQESWCRENGVPFPAWPEGQQELAARQVADFGPDVLYLSEPLGYDSAFVRRLPRRPELVLGWRSARISPDVDWTLFDGILSSGRHCLRIAKERGAREGIYSWPGFAPFLAEVAAGTPKAHDVVFCGSITPDHAARGRLLTEIAKAPLGIRGDFTPAFFMHAPEPERMPAGVAMHDHGPRWGLDMYKALASGRIVVNAGIDIADSEAPNMRIFEATGCGSFLLTERQFNIEAFFEPGLEIETYSDSTELLDKIYYFLAHAEEREAIAARGRARCLRDYAQPRRARAMDLNIRARLSGAPAAENLAAGLEQVERLLCEGAVEKARALMASVEAAAGSGLMGLEHCRALLLNAAGDAAGDAGQAVQALQRELRAYPENDRARSMLCGLLLRLSQARA